MSTVVQDQVIRIRMEPVGPGAQQINNQLRSIVAAGGGANTSLAQLSSQLNNVTGNASRMSGGMSAANNNTIRLSQAFGTLNGSTGAAAQALGRMNSTLGSLALAGATTGVLGLAGALTFSVSTANAYADRMAEISTLVDTTTFSMSQLSVGLKEQAALFGADPAAQAAASYDIISSGASSAADAVATLNSANTLAAVGATNVGVAANGLTSVINAWAGSNLTAKDAADSMFVTVRDGKISMEQLSASIGNVAPIAASLGLSLDDVGASIAALTLGGVGGSEAITNIRAALTSVIKPSAEASKLAKQIGLDFSSSALKAKGWSAFLEDVAAKTRGSQDQMAVLMGGTEALSATLALTSTASKSFNASLDNMREKAGDAAAGLKKIQDASPSFQMGRVMAAIKVEALNLGEGISAALIPALKFTADHFSTIVNIITVAMIPALGRLAAVYGTIMVQAVVTFTATAAMRFASLAAAQGVLAASTATLSGGFSALLGIVGGPLGLAIAGTGAALYYLTTNTMAAHQTVEQLAARAGEAAVQTKETGLQSLLAARGVASFGGQAGEAAGKLWQMATAARAAAVETAKLSLQKANANLDTAMGQTNAGLRSRWDQSAEMPLTTVGDGLRRFGTRAQIGWDKLWKPGEATGNKAVGVALRDRDNAAAALKQAQDAKMESYLPKPTPVVGGGGLPKADPKGGAKGNNDAENRLKQGKEFWQTLNNQLESSKSFGLELAQQTEEQKLQKILGTESLGNLKQRVDTLVQQIAQEKSLTSIRQNAFELGNKNILMAMRAKDLTEEQAKIEDALDAERLKALNNGATLADLNSGALKTELEKYRTILVQNAALEKQAGLLASGQKSLETIATFSPAIAQKLAIGNAEKDHTSRLAAINDPNAKLSAAEKMQAIKDEAIFYRDQMSKATNAIANTFSKKFNTAVDGLANIVGMFSGKLGDAVRGINGAMDRIQNMGGDNDSTQKLLSTLSSNLGAGYNQSATSMKDLQGGLKNIGKPLEGLKNAFDPAAGGSAIKGIGAAVGGAMAGYEMGSAIGGIGDALGIKNFSKGAKIGGAVGGLTGNPIIAAAASVIGGAISAIFTKPNHSSAGFTQDAQGNLAVGGVSGSSAQLKSATSGAAGEVVSGLQKIASSLGGTLSGTPNLQIGTWNDRWRVNDFSTSKDLHSKNFGNTTLHDFGDDEAAAVSYAIKKALEQGVITGLSGLAQKALGALDTDSAITFVQNWSSVMADFKSMTDPIGAAVQEIIDPLNSLRDTMVKVKSSTEDLNKIDEYRDLKLKEVLKSQLSSLTDFLDALKGEGSGVTKKSRLDADMAKFDVMRADISAGKQVNQADYTKLGQEIFGLVGEVYGTAGPIAQAMRADLINTTMKLADNVTTAFNTAAGVTPAPVTAIDATSQAIANGAAAQVAATQAQTDALLAAAAIQNDYLRQIVAQGSAANDKGYAPRLLTKNGEYIGYA